jgi:hypothetical protein
MAANATDWPSGEKRGYASARNWPGRRVVSRTHLALSGQRWPRRRLGFALAREQGTGGVGFQVDQQQIAAHRAAAGQSADNAGNGEQDTGCACHVRRIRRSYELCHWPAPLRGSIASDGAQRKLG